MNRVDRILALFEGALSLDEAVAIGATPADALAARSIAQLDLDLERRISRHRAIEEMRDFLRRTKR